MVYKIQFTFSIKRIDKEQLFKTIPIWHSKPKCSFTSSSKESFFLLQFSFCWQKVAHLLLFHPSDSDTVWSKALALLPADFHVFDSLNFLLKFSGKHLVFVVLWFTRGGCLSDRCWCCCCWCWCCCCRSTIRNGGRGPLSICTTLGILLIIISTIIGHNSASSRGSTTIIRRCASRRGWRVISTIWIILWRRPNI